MAAGVLLIALSLGACGKAPRAAAPQTTAKIAGTYAKDCPIPLSGWQRSPNEIPEMSAHYLVALDATGRITWNGAEVDMAQLRAYLRETDAGPGNELRFIANRDASCDQVRSIRSLMNTLSICSERKDCIEGTAGLPPPPPERS
ncbi:MAG: ExbD/TolR family protein [Sphingomonas sp.]